MSKDTEGYAYAFQLMGYLVWNLKKKKVSLHEVNAVTDEYKAILYRDTYATVCNGLSAGDREFILAMAKHGNRANAGDVAKDLHKTSTYISRYRLRLIEAQIIEPAEYGYVRFSLPFFDEYVRDYL